MIRSTKDDLVFRIYVVPHFSVPRGDRAAVAAAEYPGDPAVAVDRAVGKPVTVGLPPAPADLLPAGPLEVPRAAGREPSTS